MTVLRMTVLRLTHLNWYSVSRMTVLRLTHLLGLLATMVFSLVSRRNPSLPTLSQPIRRHSHAMQRKNQLQMYCYAVHKHSSTESIEVQDHNLEELLEQLVPGSGSAQCRVVAIVALRQCGHLHRRCGPLHRQAKLFNMHRIQLDVERKVHCVCGQRQSKPQSIRDSTQTTIQPLSSLPVRS